MNQDRVLALLAVRAAKDEETIQELAARLSAAHARIKELEHERNQEA